MYNRQCLNHWSISLLFLYKFIHLQFTDYAYICTYLAICSCVLLHVLLHINYMYFYILCINVSCWHSVSSTHFTFTIYLLCIHVHILHASDSASLSPTLRALQIKFTYLLIYSYDLLICSYVLLQLPVLLTLNAPSTHCCSLSSSLLTFQTLVGMNEYTHDDETNACIYIISNCVIQTVQSCNNLTELLGL